MPRNREDDRRIERDEESEEEDDETDSENDFNMSHDHCNLALSIGDSPLTAAQLNAVYKRQRGTCRITGMPFGDSGLYAPRATRRVFADPWSEDNCVIVLDVVERMRSETDLPWRSFVHLINVIGKDADL